MSDRDPRALVMFIAAFAGITACALDTQGTGDPPSLSVDDTGVALDSNGPNDTGEPVLEDSAPPDTALDGDPAETLADTAPPDAAPPCTEPGAKTFEGHCYFVLDPRDQPAAKSACTAAGAHVVTVTSTAEHTFLATVGAGDRWIGLESAMPSNSREDYRWITGEAKTVNHWYSADPDGMGPCVALHGSLQKWVDRACSQVNAVICERE